ncbi:hypothetical protein DFJ73DRAFT_856035 [Zopfochytrium polystomum]|nr:hypothetical protein DFJ73DRAFT_856035 [Zopfochytrium polystomum]
MAAEWVSRLVGARASPSHASSAYSATTPPSTLPSYTKAVVLHDDRALCASDGTALPSSIPLRLQFLLSKAGVAAASALDAGAPANAFDHEPSSTLIFSVGPNPLTRKIISSDEASKLTPEGFIVRSTRLAGGATAIAIEGANWKDIPKPKSKRSPRPWTHGNRGLAYGVYAALEDLGFAFLHPLEPTIPHSIPVIPPNGQLNYSDCPRWTQMRAIHYHTQHPLEITPFLEGFGPEGVRDQAGWESQIPEWASYCEWLIANRQNGVEWALLESGRWADFARSDVRADRLKKIVDVGHSFGVAVGVDVPIAFAQQHSFRLLKNGTGKANHLDAEKAEIHESLDWVMKAGFDFLGTENGTSEFTHTSAQTMLDWINATSDYAAEKYGVQMHIKVHCSTGQFAKGFVDPRTGKDINYNMLPHFASPSMGVLPHTVETYSLDDPAPTYGNKDFKYIREYLGWEREQNERSVVYYPETSYWVSVDIDLPLFLPLYADRRLHDLQLLASDEESSSSKTRMDGQLIFSSGWEWGYWLNDSIAARAAWNPQLEAGKKSPRDGLIAAFSPLTRHLEPTLRNEANELLADWCCVQKDLLIDGKIGDQPAPEDVNRRNGHAYLEGWDTWDDVSKLVGKMTQPDRLGLIELKLGSKWFAQATNLIRGKMDPMTEYKTNVAPLLEAMDISFTALAARTKTLADKVPAHTKDLWDDIADAAEMTALRSRQVRYLYEHIAAHIKDKNNFECAKKAVQCIKEASVIVARREKRYRVPADRIAGWTGLEGPNPTAYSFNYLWMVRSLHCWWRDTAQAVLTGSASNHVSFCNVIDPIEVGIGEGRMLHIAEGAANFLNKLGFARDFFDVEEHEPHYPQSIKHWKDLA